MNVSSANRSSLQSTQQPTQLQKTEQVREQSRRAQEDVKPVKPPQAEQSKPVVNTQGQTTGRLLNVTA
ncbi:MAG: hypothetical protein IPH37_10055 [Burkholderiales bacterium]|nr:hypothetical protein [Burkholderiales bacterium]